MQADWSVRNQFRAGSARPSPFCVSGISFPGGEEGLAARLRSAETQCWMSRYVHMCVHLIRSAHAQVQLLNHS